MEYGQGYTRDSLFRMLQFSAMYPDKEIVATLSRQLGWSHFVELIAIEGPGGKETYPKKSHFKWTLPAKGNRPGFVAPTLTARAAATLDHVTNGRVALHIITGGSDAEQTRDGDCPRPRHALSPHRRVSGRAFTWGACGDAETRSGNLWEWQIMSR